MRILITGAGGSAAYNFVEALRLAKQDVHVVGTDVRPYHLELIDLDKKYLVPAVSEPGYLAAIRAIIRREEIDFVHPQPDVEVAFLAAHRDDIQARMFLPSTTEIDLCHDKMRFHQVLKAAGVAVPAAYHLGGGRSLEAALTDLLHHHDKAWLRATRGAGSRASLPVANLLQARGWIDYWVRAKGLKPEDFMVSQFLPGREFAWQSLWYEGRLITSQARERVEYLFGALAPSGQTSSPSVARTMSRDDVNATAEAAVRAVNAHPHGVYGVDMKEDEQARPLVTEINIGRFYTTSNFFAHAGLNMPNLYVRLGLGEQIDSTIAQYNPLPDDLYWVRMMDMGHQLVTGDEWEAQKLS